MKSIIYLSLFWIVYGILGLLGVQSVPQKHRGKSYEKAYKRESGISWLMLGVPFLAVSLRLRWIPYHPRRVVWILFLLALPSIVYTMYFERKYNKRAESEDSTW